MKNKIKKVIIGVSIIGSIFLLGGCGNRTVWDTTYSFNRAIISMADGTVIKGKVQSWQEYENSDAIQVKIDGKTYYTHLQNVVLIDK